MCLAKALDKLEKTRHKKDDCLTALTLKGEGWLIEEIAQKIGRTVKATRQFLYECRKKLKPYMQPCLEDCDKLDRGD